MNDKYFDKIVEARIANIRKVLQAKGKEYATECDRMHNFHRAGQMMDCTPEKALMFFKLKHDVSISDIVDKLDKEGIKVSQEFVSEKIGDAINYLILLEALLSARYFVVPDEEKK